MRALLLGLLFALAPTPSAAQAPTLQGVVVDETGAPVPDAAVLLHRLSDAAGGAVGTDTTDAGGRFGFSLEGAGEAVHFAAVRDDAGTLFVGPIFNGTDAPADYRIVVRDDAPAGAVIMADGSILPPVGGAGPPAGAGQAPASTPEPPPPLATAAIFVFVLALMAGALLWLRRGHRRGERRELLLELATLEERGDAADREGFERERASLRERLRDLPA